MNAWQDTKVHPRGGTGKSTREEMGAKSLIMDWQSPRNKHWIRTIALLLVITFINQDLVWAQSGTPIWAKGQNGSFAFKPPTPVNGGITIPKDVAVTKEVYTTSGDKTIINIQDAHASLGAQESIASILDSLVTNYDLKLVAIEGSTGYVDTSLLRTFPDENIRKKTAEYLMAKGKMSAGEFFSITSNKPIALYGIEEKPLYEENVEQFRKIYEINNSIKNDITNLISTLKNLQTKIYTEELKTLGNNSVLHKDGKISFTERWDLVKKLAEKAGLGYFKNEIASPPSAARNDTGKIGTVPTSMETPTWGTVPIYLPGAKGHGEKLTSSKAKLLAAGLEYPCSNSKEKTTAVGQV